MEAHNNSKKRSCLPVLPLATIGLVSAWFLPSPLAFAIMLLLLCVAFAWWLAAARANAAKNAALCLLTLSLVLFVGESWFAINAWKKSSPRQDEQSRATEAASLSVATAESYMRPGDYFFRDDPKLGYGPRPMAGRMHAVKECNGKTAYNVVYSTLPSGWRVTPQHPGARTAVVLFGCSFTWGEGLNDDETFAWKLGELLGPDVQVFNFGIPGYGSHHMLAWIEHGLLVDIAARYDTVHTVYSTIRGHELRSMGYSQWDAFGPWYGFEKGRIVRKGVFADDVWAIRPYTDALLGKSMIYRKILSTKFIPRWLRFKHHAGIIREADRQLGDMGLGRLTAVLWPGVAFKDEVEKEGVPVLDLAPHLPDWNEDHDRYRIPCDAHPNATANDIVARVLYDYLVARP
ncbi:hypothetical protein LJC09_03370 [Desulfovibrio sp. OttesenSCG-928-F20]|nr:hypothetical protein [Desulfovibrio sp. OttesenSCG-928-F20]